MPTKIEWVKNPDGTKGETWNPVTGCTKVSAGCKNCYAERMAKRLAGRHGYPADEPFRVTLHPDRLEQPMRWRKPRMIFVCSMSDLFHRDVPTAFILDVLQVAMKCPQHTFQILTKRPRRLAELFKGCKPFPNIWLGITTENQQAADERTLYLLKVPAAVRFVSAEPLLGPIDFDKGNYGSTGFWIDGLDWVIVGGETGPRARPMDPDWARDIARQCQAAGVPYFFKQMSKKGPIPDDLMIREFPVAGAAV